ncbi:MAG TPA: protease pro-enzyme activation domain-containing protein [Acidimicrobiales bacterium]|nr:protease pro-enzyme activation domain-containing protein [Acidimicrobiales bacterium]
MRSTLVRTSNLLAGLSHATRLGSAPAGQQLTIDVGLAQPMATAAAEKAYTAALYQPGSALYHHFLTPAQFNARFGVPSATVRAAEAWVTSSGMHLGYVSPSGDLVSARGTLSQAATLFHLSFGLYRIGSITFVANEQAPSVPSSLPITTVVGLNTLQRMWTEQQVAALDHSPLAKAVSRTAGSLHPASAPGTSYTGTLVAQDLWGVYDTPAGTSCSYTDPSCDSGQGETAGLFGSGYSNGVVANLRVFEQRMHLPQVPVRVVNESTLGGCSATYTKAPTGPCTPNDNDVFDAVEWNLDSQAVTGMAPGLSRLDLYFSSTPFDPDEAIMFDSWANDPNGPKQMNASFGECEADPTSQALSSLPPFAVGQGALGNQFQVLADASLQEAVAEGRTLFAAAGDTGGSCPAVILPVLSAGNGVIPQPLPFDANYPCASAYAVCVGGTVVSTNGTTDPTDTGAPAADQTNRPQRTSETTWAYTGGGPADNVPEPDYQQKYAGNVNLPCVMPVDPAGNPITPGTTCRGTPDVAAMSGSGLVDGLVFGNNAYLTAIDMLPLPAGGTSLSSPLTVGMWSIVQAGAPVGGLGFANETFYPIGGQQLGRSSDFTDITQNELPTGNFYQQAGSGWDYASGWGALDVGNFLRDVDHDPLLHPTHPSGQVVAQPVTVCGALGLSSPQGNAFDTTMTVVAPFTEDQQLDITNATFSYRVLDNTPSLVVTIAGPALSTTGPPDAYDGYTFQADWTYNGKTYFAAAAVNQPPNLPATPITNSVGLPVSPPTGAVTYEDGVVDSLSPAPLHSDNGSFANGTFTIIVPLSHIGSPPVASGTTSGAVLQYPYVYDVMPDGVLVPFAMDEAVSGPPGQQLLLKSSC